MSNYIGKRFYRWTVTGISDYRVEGRETWIVKCDCGTVRVRRASQLKCGKTKSCGCLATDNSRTRNAKHRLIDTPEYRIWAGMKSRCSSGSGILYKYYGSRGIQVCDRWNNNFISFLQDMGERPSPKHSLDRIDNDGNYSKENCRWATQTVQQNNKRSNISIRYNNENYTVKEVAAVTGLAPSTIRSRIARGWTTEEYFSKSRKRGYEN